MTMLRKMVAMLEVSDDDTVEDGGDAGCGNDDADEVLCRCWRW